MLEAAYERTHARGGGVEVRVDPVVGTVQPYFMKAARAPTAFRRRCRLQLVPAVYTLAHRRRLDSLLTDRHFPQEKIDPLRPFEPPVAEKLGVVRRDDHGRPVELCREPFHLALTVEHEMPGVLGGTLARPARMVRFFPIRLARDAVVFQTG